MVERGGGAATGSGLTTACYQHRGFFGPRPGICAAKCDFDMDGVCPVCGCFDPARFVLLEFPTEAEDTLIKMRKLAAEMGVEVYTL